MDGRSSARSALRDNMAFWEKFFAGCIGLRVDSHRFERVAPIAQRSHPLPPSAIADLFLRPTLSNRTSLDPWVPVYLQTLTKLGFIDTSSILRALYKYSSSHQLVPAADVATGDHTQAGRVDPSKCWSNSYWVEEYMFYRLLKTVVENREDQDSRAVLEVVRSVSRWMALFAAASTALASAMIDPMAHAHEAVRREGFDSARAAFVALLWRLCENEPIIRIISKPAATETRKAFSDSLDKFIPSFQFPPPVLEKLELFRSQTLARLDPPSKGQEAANAAMNELLDSTVGLHNFFIPDIPISNTRAGLYIYIHAALVARPILDDQAFFAYLNIRYQGNNIDAATDLILASFDMIARAVFASDIKTEAHLLKSFLINKVPLILAQLLPPEFSGTTAEECVKKTLNQVNQTLFPTASAMFDVSRQNNPHTESVREEFCAACVLHGLVARENLEQILGEVSMSNHTRDKYARDKLVTDCLSNHEKIRGLVGEIEKTDGNVGAVCQAVVEVIRQLCNNKDTMTLKVLCSQLAQRPYALDIILLFEKLPTVLEPLCQLLDNWRYEEDQGEYQPVYEEYGAVLLLVLGFSYRYQLSPAELGLMNANGAVSEILTRGHVARELDELTDKEKEHLNGWIQGLFDSDAGGLGDDLMSSCPPRDFYLLVSTLFYNTVVAYSHGHLAEETLKSGIEYLVDTFLLPSLVPAMLFLAELLWVDSKEQKSILKVLQLILTPKSISGEANLMLSSVKNLIAKPLEHALRTYQKRDPRNQDIEPLLNALSDNTDQSRRTSGADQKDVEKWTAQQSSGLASAIGHAIGNLVTWSMNPAGNHMPHTFTYKQITTGVKVLGAKHVLRVILEAVRGHSEGGAASLVYDIATAMVCAPDPAAQSIGIGSQKPLSLREALKTEAEDCKKIQKDDSAMAEIVVRLHRRVEEQLVIPQAVLQPADMTLALDGDSTALGDAMVAAAAASGVGADALGVDPLGLDMSMGGADLTLGGPSTDSGLDGSGDADLFGGLDGDMNVFDGWDTMDMS